MQKPERFEELSALFRQPEISSWRSLVMTYRMIYSVLEEYLQKRNCSIARLQTMVVLYFEGPTVPVRLADRLMVTRGNVSTLLRRMQAEDLIQPTTERGTPSRPAFELTLQGRELFESIYPPHAENIKQLMPVLDDRILRKFIDIQEQIYDQYKIGVPLKDTVKA